jgi:hypothetical protein
MSLANLSPATRNRRRTIHDDKPDLYQVVLHRPVEPAPFIGSWYNIRPRGVNGDGGEGKYGFMPMAESLRRLLLRGKFNLPEGWFSEN